MARCSLTRGVVGGDSHARCGREGREEAVTQVSVANRRSRCDVHSMREETSDEQSNWAEGHAIKACALAASNQGAMWELNLFNVFTHPI